MEPYIGEIRIFAGGYAPSGWAPCDGRLLQINGNEMLFSLLGTTYGGDGQTNFALPNLIGKAVAHQGQGTNLTQRTRGQTFGTTTVTLTQANMPAHTHSLMMDAQNLTAAQSSPEGAYFGKVFPAATSAYAPGTTTPTGVMANETIGLAGGTAQPHDNTQPYIALTFIIALLGLYPTNQ